MILTKTSVKYALFSCFPKYVFIIRSNPGLNVNLLDFSEFQPRTLWCRFWALALAPSSQPSPTQILTVYILLKMSLHPTLWCFFTELMWKRDWEIATREIVVVWVQKANEVYIIKKKKVILSNVSDQSSQIMTEMTSWLI